MKQKAWTPIRVSGSGSENMSSAKDQFILVDLVIYNEEVKEVIQTIVEARPELRIKEPDEAGVAQLVILELDEDPSESFSFIETIAQAVEGREVFLTSPRTDSKVLLEALRAGAKEYFPQPIQPSEVETALGKFIIRYQQGAKEQHKKLGKIFCVLGGKGGVGTTSFAVNFGLSLQQSSPSKSVVLVELNQHGGDLAIFLDLQGPHSLRDIGSDLSRLDLALLSRVLSKHSSGIQVLPSGYDDFSSGRLSPEAVEPILRLLQSLFDYIVIDCGHFLDLNMKKALEMTSMILVVSTLIVPVIHRTKRMLDLIRNSGVDGKKVRVIFNRYSAQEIEVLKETESALKLPASWVIPHDYPTASSAVNNGLPIVLSAPRTPIAKVFFEIVVALGLRAEEDADQVNWVGRLRGMMPGRGTQKVVSVS